MNAQELAELYIDAWNRKSVPDVLRLLHPDAVYYDAYWGEVCSGRDLVRYFTAEMECQTYWYKPTGEVIEIEGGIIVPYLAFPRGKSDHETPVFNGAEIFKAIDGKILSVSDFYCDPDPDHLTHMASFIEARLTRSNVVHLGLSTKISRQIKRRLAELEDGTTVLLDPELTVTRLAEQVGCSVIHLFHVLEEDKGTTFTEFVNDARVRYARSLLLAETITPSSIDQIAAQSGFEDAEAFNDVFRSMVGVDPHEYSTRPRNKVGNE